MREARRRHGAPEEGVGTRRRVGHQKKGGAPEEEWAPEKVSWSTCFMLIRH